MKRSVSLNDHYKAFFENEMDGIFIADKEGKIIEVNRSGCKLLGFSKKEIIGTSSSKLARAHLNSIETKKALQEFKKKGTWFGEVEVERADGSVIDTELWARRDKANENIYIILRDISERKKTQVALQKLTLRFEEQARTLQVILSSTTNHIYVVNKKGEYEYVNKAVSDAIGKPISEIIGMTGEKLGFSKEFVQTIGGLRQKIFETGKSFRAETWFPTQEGERFFEFVLNPIRDRKGAIVSVVKTATDITDRKLLEKKKDEFLGIASHELKTPLTSIKGYTQILEKKFKLAEDEESLHHIIRVESQLNRLTTLVSDLLDVSRIDTGKMILRREEFPIADLIEDIVRDFEYMSYSHEFILHITDDAYVGADKYRIGQVLVNLIANAIKYSPQADKIIITVDTDRENVVIGVKDFGIGIDRRAQKKIFERFYQMNFENGGKFSGLGLGLFISSEIIERHGGQMWVKSRRGQGSTFYFSLPIVYKREEMNRVN